MSTEAANEKAGPASNVNGKESHSGRKERPQKRGGGGRFEPYSNPARRYRVFVSNIPFDVKWQALKDLMKEIVGEVTYVEHLMDAEGKSRGCAVVEFRTEELMRTAVEKVNKYNFNGRPLKVKEDLDGEFARRAVQRAQGGGSGGPGGMGLGMGAGHNTPPMVSIPPSLMNNPNIPAEIIHGLQAGKIGSSVFVANLDYKVGWKKLKEVFGMAGNVVRADIREDKDGKSRGMGTITFEMPIEAVQAVSMFNGQMLYNRVMHVKLDEKSMPKEDFGPSDRPPALPRGLSGVGMGLGPGGQPIDANQLNRGSGMGNMGPSGMDNMGFSGMGRIGGIDHFGGGMNNMDRFGPSGMGRGNDMDRGMGGNFDRDFGRNEMGMSRNSFGDSFDRGMGSSMGMDRMGSNMDRMGSGMDRMPGLDRMGMSDMDRLGSGFDRLGSSMDRGSSSMGPSGFDRMSGGMDFMSPMGMDRMNSNMDRMTSSFDRMGSSGMDRFPGGGGGGGGGIDRLGSGMDRMGSSGMGGQFDRPSDMDRGAFGGPFTGPGGANNARKGCQIFVRNLPFDFTWKQLKDTFNTCGHVQYADIKMENGKSKGCGVVRFENPETAERACRTMNGFRLSGREIDVRLDRNA